MKKKLFLAALAVTALASCTDNEFVGNNSPDINPNETYAISFGSLSKGLTRADHVGKDAAEMLNKKFIVSAFKGDGSTMTSVMPDYIVSYGSTTGIGGENTAGTTQSNTSDWDYVGIIAQKPSSIAENTQTIKFWDYSTTQYDFIAYSTGSADAVPLDGGSLGNNKVRVRAISWDNKGEQAYTLGGAREDLAKCYIADMVTVYKEDKDPKQPKYQDEVTFKFRNLASKVRVALYETIPGYSVKDVKFYTDDATTTIVTGASATDATLFTTGTETKDNFYTNGTFKVYFKTTGADKISDSDYNKAHVSFTPNTKGTTQSFGSFSNLAKREQKETSEENLEAYLGRTLPNASYAGDKDKDYYTIMLPNEEGTVLELRIDYTLLATDGSGEEIKIHGAKAFVPAIYAQWKPNYAYTYVFKISDNTNGWTSTVDTDPAGLYPITFDAVVVDSEEHTQSTITTVATPSITTYQKGHDVTKDEYEESKGDIYIQVMKSDGTLIPNLANTGDNPIQVWAITGKTNVTEADVMDALNIRASFSSTATTGRNGVVLTRIETATGFETIPGVDGNNIKINSGDAAKFSPSANTTYAVTYKGKDHTNTYIYTAETLSSEPTDWSGNYWDNPDGTGDAVTTFEANKTYYKKYTNRNIEWGVKVIKVQ